jgi:hypothetical protein
MKPLMIALFAVGAVMAASAADDWGDVRAGEPPACRKYNVEHPVYPWDHTVWNLVRTSEQADDWVGLSNDELRSHIDDVSYQSSDNRKMVGVLKVLAQKYGETQDPRYAYKAAVILHRYVEVLPKWGWHDRTARKLLPHDTLIEAWGWPMPPRYAGMWSTWHPYDLHQSAPLVLAYDQTYNSGQIEKLGEELGIDDLKLLLERDLLYFNMSISDRYPFSYGNTNANTFLGLLTWGQALGDPEQVHRAVRFADNMIKISYWPSRMWHENSPGYHQMITGRWASYGLMPIIDGYSDPDGYVDPVDGTRFDSLDLRTRWQPHLDMAAETMLKLIWPDGRYANINDAAWDSNTTDRWDCYGVLDEYKPQRSEPHLLTWSGHAVLGQGESADQVQARLNFHGAYGHDHYDMLNFFLFAEGEELLSETQYGKGALRAWTASLAGHNSVVIDEQNHYNRSTAPQREFTDIDHEPDVEDFDWARYTTKHGTCLTDGQLRLFATGGPNGLQVIEVDGHRAWPAELCELYQRTICMVQSSETDVYFVDIFRVKGGSVHDWMLHGPLHQDYTVDASLAMSPDDAAENKLHEWIGNLRSATGSDQWQITFTAETGQKVRTIMLGSTETEVILGDAPAMRREGDATFLDVRRQGPENVFVAVHEPYTDAPKIQSVKLTPLADASEMAVAVEIVLDGRKDEFMSTLDATGHIEDHFTGRFGYMSIPMAEGRLDAYIADAENLQAGPVQLSGVAAWEGTVVDTLSLERGDELNAIVTDAELPTAEALAGKLMLTEDSDTTTRGFLIKQVTQNDGRTVVEIDRNPAMLINDDHVKLEYFPNWGIPGGLTFRIVNTVSGPE